MPTYEFTIQGRIPRRFSIWGENPEKARLIFEDYYRSQIKDGREKEAQITRTEPDRPDYLV